MRSRLCVQFGFAARQQICNSRIRWTDSGYSNGLCGICLYGLAYKNKDYTKKARILIYMSGIFGAALMFSEHILSAKKRGNRHFVYGLYVDSLPAYVRRRVYGSEIYQMGAAFQGYSGKFIRALSSLSLGIYVTHMLVLYAFDKVTVLRSIPCIIRCLCRL